MDARSVKRFSFIIVLFYVMAVFAGIILMKETTMVSPSSSPVGMKQSGYPSKRPQQKNQDDATTQKDVVTIGVLTDIQYAPIPDGLSFSGDHRYYSQSLEMARSTAQEFQNNPNVSLVLNLGDLIDRKCQSVKEHGGEPFPSNDNPGLIAMERVLKALSVFKNGPILHAFGNHELENMDRGAFGRMLQIPFITEGTTGDPGPGDLVGYRSALYQGIRFVMIDTFDETTLGRKSSSPKCKKAVNLLTRKNPNYPEMENSPKGLEGLDERYVALNGGVGPVQLKWLDDTLKAARKAKERVVIFSHQLILPDSGNSNICLVWNYDEVLGILRKYSDIIMISFSGHDHNGGYRRDPESGIHFQTVQAILESPFPQASYAVVEFSQDVVIVNGFGNCPSAVYDLHHILD